MTTRPVRIRTTATPCPRCGSPMQASEFGIMVGPEPVRGAVDKRFCSKDCPLTVADFPNGEPDD